MEPMPACGSKCFLRDLVTGQLAGSDRFINTSQILKNDAARAQVQMADFGISHLAVGQANIRATRAQFAARVIAIKSVVEWCFRQESGVSVSQANTHSAQADLSRYSASVDEAKADVANSEQGVARAKAEWTYASNNLHRVEPLLAKQFVTADQVDRARTQEVAQAQALKQAESQLKLSQARLLSAQAQFDRAKAVYTQSQAQLQQSRHAVTTLEPLTAQRSAREAAVETAQYNFDNCRVYAPFDARVTNLILSEGAYAHTGQQIFTLIDARTWWAIGNFRETQLKHITPGMKADVYALSRPNVRLHGIVDSIGFGVTPSKDVISNLGSGLPDVERTLNWVQLASRYPVRVRITDTSADTLRLGETAVIVIRGF